MMGYKRLVQYNQQLFDKMFKSLLQQTICVYIDNIFIYSNSFEEYVQDLDKVIQILSDKGFTFKAKKAFIAYQSIEVLDYQVDHLGLSSIAKKTKAIQKIEFSRNLKDLERFIGLALQNQYLIPFLVYQIGLLQRLKTKLLNKQEANSRAQHIQHTILEPIEQESYSFNNIKRALVDLVHNYYFVKGWLLFIFLDVSKAQGFGTTIY